MGKSVDDGEERKKEWKKDKGGGEMVERRGRGEMVGRTGGGGET